MLTPFVCVQALGVFWSYAAPIPGAEGALKPREEAMRVIINAIHSTTGAQQAFDEAAGITVLFRRLINVRRHTPFRSCVIVIYIHKHSASSMARKGSCSVASSSSSPSPTASLQTSSSRSPRHKSICLRFEWIASIGLWLRISLW